ncbi:hypothetical protein ACP86_02390 [Marinobacter sp. CP1]|uniref:O-antigen ligase family protein n=1 Tax=Marinobacter sp. CP1 TaxID=1671721 RepID=UPI00069F2E5C|nr:O-antigen ligase family protein [Marinobacter sp. CP1]AKV95103.1 hypothetical protein ACP86_02390 [Marinobacter sp. CP1]
MIKEKRDAIGVFAESGCSRLFHVGLLIPVFICVIFVSLFSDFLPVWLGSYADQRFFQAALLVLVTFFVLLVPARDGQINLYLNGWPAFLVTAGFLVLALPASASDYRWVEPGLFGFFFLAFPVLGWGIRAQQCTEEAAQAFVFLIVVGCFFYAAMSLTMYGFAITDDFSKLVDVIPWGFVNMRYWSHLATWFIPLFPLALLCGPLRNQKLWRAAVFLTAGVWWWVVLLTSSRGSMISLFIAVLMVLVLFGRAVLPWLALSLKFALLGAVLWCVLSWAIPELVFEKTVIRSLHAGTSGRLPLWIEAWQMSLQNFPWGMGSQSWLTHSSLSIEYMSAKTLGHPHNMYLFWAAEYGWALVALVAVLMAVAFKRLVSLREIAESGSQQHAMLIVAFTASCLAGLSHAGVSAVFLVPASMAVAFLVLGIFWALVSESRPDAPVPEVGSNGVASSRVRSHLVIAFLVLVLGVGWLQEIWRYHQAMEEDLIIYAESSNAPLLPRFWLHGYFPRPGS